MDPIARKFIFLSLDKTEWHLLVCLIFMREKKTL